MLSSDRRAATRMEIGAFGKTTGGKGQRAKTHAHTAGSVLDMLEQRVFLSGDGLSATYWNNASSTYTSALNFSGSSVTRVDPQVNFNWGTGSPAAGLGANTFSVRWTGQVEVPVSGTYRFYTRTDDGARLWVNGQLLVDAWQVQKATEFSGLITLQAGQRYDIQMDYYDNTGNAVAQLLWSGPGLSKQAIPQAYLHSIRLPAAPTQLTAAISPSAIALDWLDNATNDAGYSILRSTDRTNFSEIARLGTGVTSYTDANVTTGTTYYYQVQAYNVAGNSAPASASIAFVKLTLAATPAANVPKVTLQWNDPLSNETGYVVERSSDGSSYQPIATLAANTTTYTDTGGMAAGATYWYRVRSTGSVAIAAVPIAVSTPDFRVFDSLLYVGKPNLSPLGMQHIYTAYENFFFDSWSADPAIQATAAPSEAATRAVARQAIAAGDQTVVIDIECWATDIRTASLAQVQTTIQWFTQVIGWLRSEAPSLKIGIYGILPLRDSLRPDLFTAAQKQAWSEANAFLAPLATQVDYVSPSLYTFYQDPTIWQAYAQANIDQAKQYGKPIMPFIWNEYHPGNTTIPAGTALPADFWRMELDVLRQSVSGVVIWGGWKENWDSTAPWWLKTVEFTSVV